MSLATYEKNSQATRSYPTLLTNLGLNEVTNPVGSSNPSGLVFDSVTFDEPTSEIVALIGGGVVGVSYLVTIEFDLSNGEHPVFTFVIIIQDD